MTLELRAEMTRPSTDLNVDTIPDELKQRRQWVLWEPVERNGKWTKKPLQVGHPVSLQSNQDNGAHYLRDSFQYLIAATPLFPGFLVFSDQAYLA